MFGCTFVLPNARLWHFLPRFKDAPKTSFFPLRDFQC
jgi:hypothetical protein